MLSVRILGPALLASLPLLSPAWLAGAITPVTLNPSANPSSGDAGVSLVSVTGHGFPSGVIPPGNVGVTLKPSVSGPPTGNVRALKVKVVSGSTEVVTFRIPAQLVVPTATLYAISIAGATSTGTPFQSVNTAALTVNGELLITTTSPLPAGIVGMSYSQTLAATGGTGSYTWSISTGALPAGLSLNAATGQISGQPAAAGTSNFTATVTDSARSATSTAFALTINPAPVIQSLSPNSGNAGLSLQVAITGSNTHFMQGTTTATFGPGTSVGGAPDGQPGPVTVMGPTSATAQVTIGPSAAPGAQTVTVTTGAEHASLVNGFTILAPIPYITVQTTAPKPLAQGFSGFNDASVIHGVEYNDPKFLAMVLPLKPGFIRYPGGSDSLAFDWQSAHENQPWFNSLKPYLTTNQTYGLTRASFLGQAKGGVCFTSTPPGTCYSNFSELTSYTGANAIVCVNGYTDFNLNSASTMVAAAQGARMNVVEWEIGNEPYAYPLFFPTPADYAGFENNPWYQNIIFADPSATVGLFYQGPFSSFSSNYQSWDDGMHAYSPQYWNAVSTHVYPINGNVTVTQEEQQLNSVLGYATDAYVVSYLDPLIGPNTPIFITELSANTISSANFETYLYYGIFLAEYISRMSTVPNVKGVGVQALYLGNMYQQGIIRAVDDFETYLINQVMANPNYSTNTATDPNTQFQFYYSAGGVALQVANLAINSSNAVWPTVVNGNVPTVPTAPIQGYGGQPIPAVFAQGYQAIDGSHYLLITNKSGQPLPFAIIVNGTLLEQSVSLTYVSNPSDTAANTAANQNNLQVSAATSPNPIMIGPYSVTAVHW
jgi:Putative Ig domain